MEESFACGPGEAGCPNLGLSGDCDTHGGGEGHPGNADKRTARTSVKRCREALGEQGVGLTDEEIAQMRDYLYQLLDIIADDLEQDLRHGRSGTCGAA